MGEKSIPHFDKMKRNFSILKLQEEIDKRIEIAVDSLMKNDTNTARENIEWIKTAEEVVDKNKKKPNKTKWAIAIGLASVFLIGLGLTLRIPKINISADIT